MILRLLWLPCVVVGLVLAAGAGAGPPDDPPAGYPALGGMTGLVNTPTAQVTPEGWFRAAFGRYDRVWAYEKRGRTSNDAYAFTVGFLPRIEVSLRATIEPGISFFDTVSANATDRMASGRVLLLPESGNRPALAVGADDVTGTRRYHSLYAVATKTVPTPVPDLTARVTAGYAPTWLRAFRHILDGPFGGVELGYAGAVSVLVDHDTEKWNGAVRGVLLDRIAVQAAWLHLDTFTFGASLSHPF